MHAEKLLYVKIYEKYKQKNVNYIWFQVKGGDRKFYRLLVFKNSNMWTSLSFKPDESVS